MRYLTILVLFAFIAFINAGPIGNDDENNHEHETTPAQEEQSEKIDETTPAQEPEQNEEQSDLDENNQNKNDDQVKLVKRGKHGMRCCS